MFKLYHLHFTFSVYLSGTSYDMNGQTTQDFENFRNQQMRSSTNQNTKSNTSMWYLYMIQVLMQISELSESYNLINMKVLKHWQMSNSQIRFKKSKSEIPSFYSIRPQLGLCYILTYTFLPEIIADDSRNLYTSITDLLVSYCLRAVI